MPIGLKFKFRNLTAPPIPDSKSLAGETLPRACYLSQFLGERAGFLFFSCGAFGVFLALSLSCPETFIISWDSCSALWNSLVVEKVAARQRGLWGGGGQGWPSHIHGCSVLLPLPSFPGIISVKASSSPATTLEL